jgi:hypothetical protein
MTRLRTLAGRERMPCRRDATTRLVPARDMTFQLAADMGLIW